MHDINRIKTFQDLRDAFHESRYSIMENCVQNLEESTEFRRGFSCGELSAYDEIDDVLRSLLKYTDLE